MVMEGFSTGQVGTCLASGTTKYSPTTGCALFLLTELNILYYTLTVNHNFCQSTMCTVALASAEMWVEMCGVTLLEDCKRREDES